MRVTQTSAVKSHIKRHAARVDGLARCPLQEEIMAPRRHAMFKGEAELGVVAREHT